MAVSTPNVWVCNAGLSHISKFDLNGNFIASFESVEPPHSAAGPQAIAVDLNGNVFYTNRNAAPLARQHWGRIPFGSSVVNTYHSIGGNPTDIRGVAADKDGNIWIAVNGADSVQKWSPTGTMLGSFLVTTVPVAVAIDGNRYVWVGDALTGVVTRLSLTGLVIDTLDTGARVMDFAVQKDNSIVWTAHTAPDVVVKNTQHGEKLFTVPIPSIPTNIAADADDNLWVTDHYNQRVLKISGTNGVILATINTGVKPLGIAVDQNNNVWCVNVDSDQLIKINSSGIIQGTFSTNRPRIVGDFTGFILQQLPDSQTESFEGTLFVYSEDVSLYDGRIWVHSIASAEFDGTLFINSEVATAFAGTCVVYTDTTELFNGSCLVSAGGLDAFDGGLIIFSTLVTDADGKLVVNDVASAEFDGALLVETAITTLFDGVVRVVDQFIDDFNGQLIVLNDFTAFCDGRIYVYSPITYSFNGWCEVYGGPDTFHGLLFVIEATTMRSFGGELTVAEGQLIDGEVSIDDTYVSRVAFAIETKDILVPPRPVAPETGRPQAHPPVFALPNPVPAAPAPNE